MQKSFGIVVGLLTVALAWLASEQFLALPVTAERFRSGLDKAHTVQSSTFLGVTQDRAYLENSHVPSLTNFLGLGWARTIWWCDIASFTSEEQKALRAGQNPWRIEQERVIRLD